MWAWSELFSQSPLCVSRGLQRDVVNLSWPIAPSYMSPNAVGGGSCGVSANEYSYVHHVTWRQNKLWRSNSIFNLCVYLWWWQNMNDDSFRFDEDHLAIYIAIHKGKWDCVVGGPPKVSLRSSSRYPRFFTQKFDIFRKTPSVLSNGLRIVWSKLLVYMFHRRFFLFRNLK